ncbi:hypothetical protein DPMN_020995 [Dreissena polymorpha]|uniref:Uncharacterized protein n=1 Tax=Dreissena polymorpha TaxID=45954 RepID=A0A9D4NN37_DREPO|nr:hypothetical protein DPMN_020995 [Dreissena polymorpha]
MAILQRPYHVPYSTIASLTECRKKRRTSATTLNMFKVVVVGSRPEHFFASLLRFSGVYGARTATWVAIRTLVRCDGGIR